MLIDFEKWHGCNNDFIVTWVDERHDLQVSALTNAAKNWCARNGGSIGGDGLLIISYLPTDRYSLSHKLRIVNSDGSIAQTCGNGIRCAAGSVLRHYHQQTQLYNPAEAVEFQLSDRKVVVQFLELLTSKQEFRVPLMAVDMGRTVTNDQLPWYRRAKEVVKDLNNQLKRKLSITEIGACEIGNQHLVLFCEEVPAGAIYEIGSSLQKQGDLWDGINVHLVESVAYDRNNTNRSDERILKLNTEEMLRASVWERGAGPTQACGSGACAIVATAHDLDLLERGSWCSVLMPGGPLYVKQDEAEDSCQLAGPATWVFDGKTTL